MQRDANTREFQAIENALKQLRSDFLRLREVSIDTDSEFATAIYINSNGTICTYILSKQDYEPHMGWTQYNPNLVPQNPQNYTAPNGAIYRTTTIQTTGNGGISVSLPKGLSSYLINESDEFYGSPWGGGTTPVEPPKCECGSHKTYGPNLSADQHSTWCKVYKKDGT